MPEEKWQACSCETVDSHDGASPIALLRASLFLTASADDRAEDLSLGAVAVGLQELDVAVDEDGLAFLESADRWLACLLSMMVVQISLIK